MLSKNETLKNKFANRLIAFKIQPEFFLHYLIIHSTANYK